MREWERESNKTYGKGRTTFHMFKEGDGKEDSSNKTNKPHNRRDMIKDMDTTDESRRARDGETQRQGKKKHRQNLGLLVLFT